LNAPRAAVEAEPIQASSPWLASTAGNLVVGVCGVVSGALLARTLGPAVRGVVAQATLWPSLVLTAGAVVNVQTIAYFRARYGIAGRQACLMLTAILATPLLLLALGVNWAALGLTGKPGYAAANVFALSLPLNMIGGVLTAALLGEMRFKAFWSIRAMTAVLMTGGVAILAVTRHLTPVIYCALVVVVWLGTAIVALGVQRPGVLRQAAPPMPMLREAMRFGVATNATMLPYQVNLRLDQLIISLVLPTSALGFYAASFAWSSILSLVGGAFSMVVLAETARVDPTDRMAFEAAVARVRRGCIIMVIAGVAAALAAQVAIPLIFGVRFAKAIRPAQILCIASVFLNINLLLHEFARGLGRPGLGGIPESLGVIVSVVGLWLLIPTHLVTGAALASLGSYAAICAALVWSMSRRLPHLKPRMLAPQRGDLDRIWAVGISESRRLLGGLLEDAPSPR
jgi:O-antigen/teichoic acid export membrane protein